MATHQSSKDGTPLMAYDEMTIADILRDPLIRQMMRADGVTLREMEELLRDAVFRDRHHRNLEGKDLQAPCQWSTISLRRALFA